MSSSTTIWRKASPKRKPSLSPKGFAWIARSVGLADFCDARLRGGWAWGPERYWGRFRKVLSSVAGRRLTYDELTGHAAAHQIERAGNAGGTEQLPVAAGSMRKFNELARRLVNVPRDELRREQEGYTMLRTRSRHASLKREGNHRARAAQGAGNAAYWAARRGR